MKPTSFELRHPHVKRATLVVMTILLIWFAASAIHETTEALDALNGACQILGIKL